MQSHWASASCVAMMLLTYPTPALPLFESLTGQIASIGGSQERIAINDNRQAAGATSDGVLAIHLDARIGSWHPDRDSDAGVLVKAFAVDGGPLQIPGPLIRVREGCLAVACAACGGGLP